MIQIADTLALPDEIQTRTLAILAQRGKGKTYAAAVLAEDLLAQRLATVIFDPLGVWYGLRTGADGSSSAGYDIPIIGGPRSDIPVDPSHGAAIGEWIAKQNQSAILDLSDWRPKPQREFVLRALEEIYQHNTAAVQLIFDEADLWAPQNARGNQVFALCEAMEAIVRRGRVKGIGATLISQRPQQLNKSVLSQADVLIALGLSHPRDRKAIVDWIGQTSVDAADTLERTLPGLATGRAYVWAPAWEIFELVQIRTRRTYDSSRTPDPGQKHQRPELAAVNLAALSASLQPASEAGPSGRRTTRTAELSAGHALTQERDELRRMLETATANLKRLELTLLDDFRGALDTLEDKLHQALHTLSEAMGESLRETRRGLERQAEPAKRETKRQPTPAAAAGPTPNANTAPQKILAALAHGTRDRVALAILAGYPPTASTIRNALSELRRDGMIGEGLQLTVAGRTAAGPPSTFLNDERARLAHWRPAGTGVEAALFDLLSLNPDGLTPADVAHELDIDPGKSTLRNAASTLRRRGLLIRAPNRRLRLHPLLCKRSSE